MNQKDADSYNDMMGTDVIPDEALKIDMGVAVTVEEKQALWPDEERIDIIGSNGPTGDHYKPIKFCGKNGGGTYGGAIDKHFRKGFAEMFQKGIGGGSGG